MKHFKYFWYLVKHKWFVLLAGLRLKVSLWRLITHDLSKFRPSEWFPYASYFYGRLKQDVYTYRDGKKVPLPIPKDDCLGQETFAKDEGKAKFDEAWLHHQRRNKHHWQYWLLIEEKNYWRIWSHNDCVGPFQIARNNRPYNFWIDIPLEKTEEYKELVRLTNELNARPTPIPMPMKYLKEMVADWAGAGRAITGQWGVIDWYEKNKDYMLLHPKTRYEVENLLKEFAKVSPIS